MAVRPEEIKSAPAVVNLYPVVRHYGHTPTESKGVAMDGSQGLKDVSHDIRATVAAWLTAGFVGTGLIVLGYLASK